MRCKRLRDADRTNHLFSLPFGFPKKAGRPSIAANRISNVGRSLVAIRVSWATPAIPPKKRTTLRTTFHCKFINHFNLRDTLPDKNSTTSSTTFTYHQPDRVFEGSPYDATRQAVRQTYNVANLLRRSIRDTNVQTRNAFMQRNLDTGKKPEAEAYEASAEHRLLQAMDSTVKKIQIKLTALEKAVSYDPKNPPKED